MKSLLRLRPSPALVVSLLALFVSLGGVSYGVATGFIDSREIRDNTIRTKDLRNEEVRGRDIRNSTVQGRDVALNTLRGVDIDEAELGQVPLAARAGTATSAASAATAESAGSVATLRTIATTIAPGSPAVLVSHGPLTIRGSCAPVALGLSASLTVETTEGNSAAQGSGPGVPVLSPTDPPLPIASVEDSAGGTRSLDATTFVASAPSGRALSGVISLLVDAGAPGSGSCGFHGHAALS